MRGDFIGVTHHFNPISREAFVVLAVVERNNLVVEAVVDALGGFFRISIESPTDIEPVDFAAPAVGDSELEDAIRDSFHTASTRGFFAVTRNIEPNVAAAGNHFADFDVVIRDEEGMTS